MITLKLYSFQKRENSTKLPGTASLTLNVTLLENTSLMKPVFMLSLSSNPIVYNYAYVPDFNRYYFITEVSSDNNFWYLTCEEDCLASFKSQVGAESHYVVRAASAYDGYISDSAYITKTDCFEEYVTGTNPIRIDNNISYVIGIAGRSPLGSSKSQFGSMVYYWVRDEAMRGLLNYLLGNVNQWSTIDTDDYEEGVQKALINPLQYISSCIALPIEIDTTEHPKNIQSIRFGYYEYPLQGTTEHGGYDYYGRALTNETFDNTDFSTTIRIPKHPEAEERGEYLNCEPYMSYTLHYGPFGDIPLEGMLLIDAEVITLRFTIDMMTGLARLRVYPDNNQQHLLYDGTAQLGIPIQLSQISFNKANQDINSIKTGIGSLTNLASGNYAGALTGAADLISSILFKQPNYSSTGASGSYLHLVDPNAIYILAKGLNPTDENLEELGRPLCQIRQISTLSGYIQCSNADCTITGTKDEANKINDFLNGGFFYE